MVRGEHTVVLAAQPDDSADVVYFDPMFRKPQKASGSFDVRRPPTHAAGYCLHVLLTTLTAHY